MPASREDREQLRHNHPGMAAHLPPAVDAQRVPPSLRWRVGHSQGHNVYLGDVHRLVVLGEPDDAAALASDVVDALNAAGDWDREAARARVTDAVMAYFDEQRAAGADVTAEWIREHAADIFAVVRAARAPQRVVGGSS